MSNTYKFDYFNDWMAAARDFGYSVESWGICGSKSAHDIDGRVKGEWLAAFDTYDGRANGWLDYNPD